MELTYLLSDYTVDRSYLFFTSLHFLVLPEKEDDGAPLNNDNSYSYLSKKFKRSDNIIRMVQKDYLNENSRQTAQSKIGEYTYKY